MRVRRAKGRPQGLGPLSMSDALLERARQFLHEYRGDCDEDDEEARQLEHDIERYQIFFR